MGVIEFGRGKIQALEHPIETRTDDDFEHCEDDVEQGNGGIDASSRTWSRTF